MKKQFVTYEIALALKELGFDEEVIATYDTDSLETNNELKIFAFSVPDKGIFELGFKKGWCIKAPLWSQLIDWFRNKYKLIIEVSQEEEENNKWYWEYSIYYDCNLDKTIGYGQDEYMWDKYEEAREKAILKAIELIKEETNESN